jgi:hypothetical protein
VRVWLLIEPQREEKLNRQDRQARQEINNYQDRNATAGWKQPAVLFSQKN